MKIRTMASALLLTTASISYGQAVPAGSVTPISTIGTGPNLPNLDGVFHYALTASEAVQLGYYGPGDVTHSTIFSANAAYTAKSEVRPFNFLLAGGVILANQQGQGNTGYVNAAISQGYLTRKWAFNISDSISFLPQSPTTGLSGIPGTGDLGAIPVQGPVEGPAGGVFSNAGNRVANSLSGSVERQVSRTTSISGAGSWSVLRFLGDNTGNLDNTQITGTVAVNQRLDARDTVSVNAVYSTFDYSGNGSAAFYPNFQTRGINGSFQRLLSRTLSMSISAGPQWVSSSNSALIPSTLNVAASGSLSYARGSTTAALGFTRGANGGSGVLPGAISDSLYGSLGHTFGRNWVASFSVGYSHTSGLTNLLNQGSVAPTHEIYDSVFGGAQLTRRISTHFSGFVSYTAQDQSNNFSQGAQNALNGTSQTFGIGITFTPRSTRLGQF